VVTHPFHGGDGDPKALDVLELSPSGALTITGVSFSMAKSAPAPIAFTPDGEIGLVAQDDGKVGVFRFRHDGRPEIAQDPVGGDFWAASIVMDPSGMRAYALDPDSAAHAGGVYELVQQPHRALAVVLLR
jgi:hypothetical protein